MNSPGDFEVSISGTTRELLTRLRDQAALLGLRNQFIAALRTILSRLRTDPMTYGEEVFDLRVMQLTIKVGVELPLVVEFGVYSERRQVWVRTFRFITPSI